MTALQTTRVSHCEYADDIALSTNAAQHLQLQLDRFHTFTALKRLTLKVHKTKTMALFCSNPPIFRYSGTQLKNVQAFKYLGTILIHNERMTNASNQMARNFAGAIMAYDSQSAWLGLPECGGFAQSWVSRTGSMPCSGFFKSLLMDKFGLQRLSNLNHLLQPKPTSTTNPF